MWYNVGRAHSRPKTVPSTGPRHTWVLGEERGKKMEWEWKIRG